MATQNRLGWTVEGAGDGTARIYNAYGAPADINGMRKTYASVAAAESAIAREVARRDRCNAAGRARHSLMTGLGLVRCRDGRYE
jgi:hypothetical protein